jgi:surface antigen
MRRIKRRVHDRRFARYSLLTLNALILVSIVFFVAHSSPTIPSGSGAHSIANVNGNDTNTDPLDLVSSADIAVNLARATNLAESTAVTNHADSTSAELAMPPATSSVIAKPQVVTTDLKSRKDIFHYVVQNGDTIASIAAKFNVTSDSITASNSITGNQATPGTQLVIPPINGIVYIVKAGDTTDSLAQKYSSSADQIVAFNDAELAGITVGEQILIPNGRQPIPVVVRSAAIYYVATYGSNGYDYGFCTWYVANMRNRIGRPLPSNLGDAWTWDDRASAAGLPVSTTPTAGAAVVMSSNRAPGHVAYVEQVNDDGSVWVSEMNSHGQKSITDTSSAGGWGRVDFKLIPASAAHSYNYIH